jgi:hypothetical protein
MYAVTNVFTTQNLESSHTTDLYIATEFAERCNSYDQFQELNILIGQHLFSLCLRSIVCSGRHYSQVVYIEEGLGQGVHTRASFRFWKS